MCRFNQHQPEAGADGVPFADLQHPWQALESQGCHMMRSVFTPPPPELSQKSMNCSDLWTTFKDTLSRKQQQSHRVLSQ